MGIAVDAINFDCHDWRLVARFWKEFLGYWDAVQAAARAGGAAQASVPVDKGCRREASPTARWICVGPAPAPLGCDAFPLPVCGRSRSETRRRIGCSVAPKDTPSAQSPVVPARAVQISADPARVAWDRREAGHGGEPVRSAEHRDVAACRAK